MAWRCCPGAAASLGSALVRYPFRRTRRGQIVLLPTRPRPPEASAATRYFMSCAGERTRREHGKNITGFPFFTADCGRLSTRAPPTPALCPVFCYGGRGRGSQACVGALGKPHAHIPCPRPRPCLEAGSGRGYSGVEGVGSPCRRGISVRSCLCPARPHVLASLRCCAHTPPAAQAGTRALCGRVCWPAWILDPRDVIARVAFRVAIVC